MEKAISIRVPGRGWGVQMVPKFFSFRTSESIDAGLGYHCATNLRGFLGGPCTALHLHRPERLAAGAEREFSGFALANSELGLSDVMHQPKLRVCRHGLINLLFLIKGFVGFVNCSLVGGICLARFVAACTACRPVYG